MEIVKIITSGINLEFTSIIRSSKELYMYCNKFFSFINTSLISVAQIVPRVGEGKQEICTLKTKFIAYILEWYNKIRIHI